MGILANQKHEMFAQLIAGGSSNVDAFEKAGYPRHNANASRLRLNERVDRRIRELGSQRAGAVQIAALSAAEKAGVDQFWVMRNLRTNAVMAMRRNDRAAATRCIELIGKHLGMFVDKKQIDINVVDDSDEYLRQLMEIVGIKPLQLENDGLKDGSDEEPDLVTIDIVDENG